jgi:hypothetical protein
MSSRGMPALLRYEEDGQSFLVAVVHPTGFQRVAGIVGKDERTCKSNKAGPDPAGRYSFTAPVNDET